MFGVSHWQTHERIPHIYRQPVQSSAWTLCSYCFLSLSTTQLRIKAGDTWCTMCQCTSPAFNLVQHTLRCCLSPAQILRVSSCFRTLRRFKFSIGILRKLLAKAIYIWPGPVNIKIRFGDTGSPKSWEWGHYSDYYNFLWGPPNWYP